MDPKNEIDPNLLKKLSKLKTSPARNIKLASDGRSAFLKEAADLLGGVTPPQEQRHNRWIQNLQSIFVSHRKENSPMISVFASIIIALSLIFGSGAATVAAAQSSQPNQFLYNVKLLSEDTLLNLTSNPESQFNLALDYVSRRAGEIQTMINAGQVPSEQVQVLYQNQIEQATRLAVSLPEDKAIQALEQIQTRLETQLQEFTQNRTNASPEAIAAMTQTQLMLQERVQLLETGQINLAQLRNQIRLQEQLNNPGQAATVEATAQGTQIAPGSGDGNPWASGTPTPGSSYGPGPGTEPCYTCTPGSGTGLGSQGTQQQGQPTYQGSQPAYQQTMVSPGGAGGK